jgi:hypothetical protein
VHALRIRRTRTERADAKCRNPKSKFCHCYSSPYDIRDWLVAPGAGMSNSNFWDCLEAKGATRRFAGSSQASRYAKDAPSDASAFDDIRCRFVDRFVEPKVSSQFHGNGSLPMARKAA